MKKSSQINRLDWGFALFIGLILVQDLFIGMKVYWDQSFTMLELVLCLTAVVAYLIGFCLPAGISVVCIFIFMVSYFVWIATVAPISLLTISSLVWIPANTAVASFIRTKFIRSKRMMERLDALKDVNPQIDLYTELENKATFASTLVKQSSLANRYAKQYSFSMALFQIEFRPLVLESLGSEGYGQLLLNISQTIQQQIRYEDYKFSIGDGQFVILCPMTDQDHFYRVTDRIKQAITAIPLVDKKGQTLTLIVRAGAMSFNQADLAKYQQVDDVIAMLVRRTETDLVGEYI
ncbi:GGDEF domain-containing protein [Paenibacillus terrigena]|uniref:GGDEF domain-containing protein n=1 Tax=Paenibacillus terrigena TaxID=369333 RepID=UPI00035CC7E3|nr:diguanylate cyclase [Paenibacillus terrigena]